MGLVCLAKYEGELSDTLVCLVMTALICQTLKFYKCFSLTVMLLLHQDWHQALHGNWTIGEKDAPQARVIQHLQGSCCISRPQIPYSPNHFVAEDKSQNTKRFYGTFFKPKPLIV